MNILLTGATGLVGGELTSWLMDDGHCVIAIMHQSSEIRSSQGGRLNAADFADGWPAKGKIASLKGDITKVKFGVSGHFYDQLSSKVDLIIHCAATTDFGASAATYDTVNVQGTANMLELSPDIPFLYISTAYVCGTSDGIIAESPHDENVEFNNRYEASKAAAESLVKAAPNPSAIARPSIVVGRHSCGTIQNFDNFYRLFKLMAEGRISALPSQPKAALDFVPIDHVAGALCDIVKYWPDAAGKIFHICSGQAVPLQKLLEIMADFDGLSAPKMLPVDAYCRSELSPRERRLHDKLLRPYLGYLSRSPAFACDALRILSGRACPAIDRNAVARQIQYCIDTGFIKAPLQNNR